MAKILIPTGRTRTCRGACGETKDECFFRKGKYHCRKCSSNKAPKLAPQRLGERPKAMRSVLPCYVRGTEKRNLVATL